MRRDAGRPKPLYRKVNTRTLGVDHGRGHAARDEWNTKAGAKSSKHSGQRHGLDYTPLCQSLIKSVGELLDDVIRAIRKRVAEEEAIYYLVARSEEKEEAVARVGESSYFSGLYVDVAGILQKVAPELTVEALCPMCACCTQAFNGEVLPSTWSAEIESRGWSW